MKKQTVEEVMGGRTIGQMMAEGMQELAGDLANGLNLQAKYQVRNVNFSFTDTP